MDDIMMRFEDQVIPNNNKVGIFISIVQNELAKPGFLASGIN